MVKMTQLDAHGGFVRSAGYNATLMAIWQRQIPYGHITTEDGDGTIRFRRPLPHDTGSAVRLFEASRVHRARNHDGAPLALGTEDDG